MLKRIMSFMLAAIMIFSLAACAKEPEVVGIKTDSTIIDVGNEGQTADNTVDEDKETLPKEEQKKPTKQETESNTKPTETVPPTEENTEETVNPEENLNPDATGKGDESTEESKPPVEETKPEETVPAVNFTIVDEIVYATSYINVRKGPGTEYEKVGSLNIRDSVKRIGVGDNGWSKIIYNDQETYVSSSYISTTEPPKEEPKPVVNFVPTGSYSVPDFSIYDEYEREILQTVLAKINENKDNLDIHEENIEFRKEISYESYYRVASFFYVYYGQKRAVDETFDFVRSSDTNENGERICYLRLRYDDIRQFESELADVRNKVDNILRSFEDGDEKYILKQISEYLRKNITYTYDKYSIQNALLEGQSVCNGYALAFNMLANRAGIKSDLCVGKASNGEYHAWNRVTLDDGSQYFYDITWYDGSSGARNNYIHAKTNFHGAYRINDYTACWEI